MKKTFILFVVVLSVLTVGCFKTEVKHTTPWKTDIAFAKNELAAKQKDVYQKITEKEYNNKFDELYNQSPGLDDMGIKLRISETVAKIKDGNTAVILPKGANIIPLKFIVFDDGMYLFAAQEENKKYIGKKLIRVNNVELKEIYDKIRPFLTYEHISAVKDKYAEYLTDGDMLKYLGIIENAKSAAYEFESTDAKGAKKEILTVEVLKEPETLINYWGISKTVRPETENTALDNYSTKYIPNVKAIYIQLNKIEDTKKKKFKDVVAEIFKQAEKQKARNMIIDLRNCNSGDYKLFEKHFMPRFNKSAFNEDGYGFIITGRKTYGAGVAAAALLVKNDTAAIFGEPTFTGPHHIAETGIIKLPVSKLEVTYSKKYYRILDESVTEIRPHYNIKYYSTDYFAGKDSAYEAVIRYLKSK